MTARASRRALVAIVTALGLALVIMVAAALLDTLPGTGITASPPSIPGPAPALPGPDASTGDDSATAPSEPDESSPDDAGPVPERTATEVLPESEEKSPLGLPPSAPLPNLVTLPLPATASETGALVAGYPAELIPPSPGATVVSSSVASAGNRLQVTLTASTSMATAAVLDFYRVTFAANNLVDSIAPAADGSQALLFSRGSDTVLLTVTPTADGHTTYSVFGAFTAKT
jgi:hypothetical protein